MNDMEGEDVGTEAFVLDKIFGHKREGNANKCSALCCLSFLYVILTTFFIFDVFIFELLPTSKKIDQITDLLQACEEDTVTDTFGFKIFEFIFSASERILVSSLFFLVLLNIKRVWYFARDTYFGRTLFNFSKQKEQEKLIRFLENTFLIFYFIYLFVFLLPIMFIGLKPLLISNRGVNEAIVEQALNAGDECNSLIIFGDDIFRIFYYFIIMLPLLFISRKVIARTGEASFAFSFGRWFYYVFLLVIVIEVCRQDFLALYLIAPLYVLLLLEAIFFNFFFKKEVLVKTYKISDKYLLLFWTGRTVEKFSKKEGLFVDSVTRLFRLRINQYQMQLPQELKTDLGAEYGTRSCSSFNNAGNMFSLGMNETVVDEEIEDEDNNLPFNRSRLIESQDGVLKLNDNFMARSRSRQKTARDRNKKIMNQFRGQVSIVAPVTNRNTSTYRKSKNIGGDKVQSSFVEVDLTNADEEGDQIVTGTREDDVFEENIEAVVVDVTPTQEFDKAVIMKLEPLWDESGTKTSKLAQTFGNLPTIEQLNDLTNPVRCTLFGQFAGGEIDYLLNDERDVICVGSGGGAMFLLDTMRYIIHHELGQCRVHLLFTTGDLNLLQWFVESVDDMFYSSHKELSNVKVIAALTEGEVAMHNVGRLQVSSAFGAGNNHSYDAQRGSEFEPVERKEQKPKGFQINIQKSARKIIDTLNVSKKQQSARITRNTSNNASSRGTSIRFRWGKVLFGRINFVEKFQRLEKLNFECSVIYQGGSKGLEQALKKGCDEVGFKYLGLNSFEALRSMSPENPPLLKMVTAMNTVSKFGDSVGMNFGGSRFRNTMSFESGNQLLVEGQLQDAQTVTL